MASLRSFWGPIFKDKCGVCLQDSGWVTMQEANEWAHDHWHATKHFAFSRYMRKNGGRKHVKQTSA